VRSQVAEGPVLSGQIPSLAGPYVRRKETGLAAASLPAGETTVLVPSQDPASGPGWLGGSGKTTLAAALAWECLESGTAALVVWVTATGRDAVMNGYARALRELDLLRHTGGNAERTAGRLLDWLARADRPWLIVLDDLADPAAVEGLWPAGPAGRVLVTAQRADAAAAAPRPRPAGVGPFSPREAMDFLSACVQDPGQRAGALDLAGDLGFWPVSLGLAGAFMSCTGLDCRQYRASFAERRRRLADAFTDDATLAAATAWSLSCELADQISPYGLAGRVLALLSMLSPHGIPGAVLASEAARGYLAGTGGVLAEVTDIRAALGNLARAGLVTVDDTSPARTVRVHDMVQAIARQHLPAAEGRQAARAAADALAQAWPGPGPEPAPAAQALRECTAKLHQITGSFLWTPQCHPALLKSGQSLHAEGLAGPAADYWQEMLDLSEQLLGAEHPQTSDVRDLLGSACEESGRLDEAIALYEAALSDVERVLGSGHPDTRPARERLARAYVAADRKTEAVQMSERALAHSMQSLGPDHADTLAAQANLASAYLAAGQLGEAAAALEDAVARREWALGPDHPDTIAARGSLADVYRASGRFKEAINLGKRTVADLERAQGADHPDTTAARAGLASAYRSAKKLKDAHRLYERVLADRERGQGTDHPDTILARTDLALAYLSLRKMGQAITQYERALADAERVLGRDHAITRGVRQSLQEAARYASSVMGIDIRSAGRSRGS
jgi:tetratricopeptide (TPR) repeat protein